MNHEILLLLLQECQRNYNNEGEADGFSRLLARRPKEETVKIYDPLPPEQHTLLSQAWYSFHEGMQYPSFQTFYAKDVFCASTLPEALDAQRFLHLIADREFLFSNYNDHYVPTHHCTIRDLLTTPAKCMDMDAVASLIATNPSTITQSDIDALVAQVTDSCLAKEKDMVKAKLSAGLEASNATLRTYERYMENYEALQQSFLKRQELMASHSNHKWQFKQTISLKDEFKTQVPPEDLEEVAQQLSALFCGYLHQVFGTNYKSSTPDDTSSQSLKGYKDVKNHKPQYWVEDMKGFYRHIFETRCPKYQYPLVFFHLFTQYQKKIANRTLRKFTIDLHQKEQDTSRVPPSSTSNEAKKIKDEIQLFDHLMLVFETRPIYVESLKFEFFLYSRYDAFQHYAVSDWVNPTQGASSELTFQNPINYEDGVDHFANLLRRNIQLCIPNSVKNLGVNLTRKHSVSSDVFAYLLIQDAHKVPPSSRLTQRISLQVEEDFENLMKLYNAQNNILQDVSQVLRTYCEKHRLLFDIENAVYDSVADTNQKDLLVYSAYILEVTLKDKMHEMGRDNLRNQAERLFADCLLPGVRIVRGE